MTAFSADSIESTTVVGYSSQSTLKGFVMSGASFKSVGTEGYSLQGILPVGENVADWCHYISLVNTDSATGETYVYLTATGAPDGKTAGWYDADSGEKYINHTFEPGEGFFFVSDVEGVSLQTSGVVNSTDVNMEILKGFSGASNPLPVNLNVQDILVTDKNAADWCYYISLVNNDSSTGDTYVYLTATGAPDSKTAGWYDADSGEKYINHTFAPGEGFFFVSDVDTVQIKIKKIAL